MDKIVRTLKAMHLNLAVIFGSCILNDFYRTDSGMISKPFGLYSGVPIYFSFVSGSALQQQKVRPSLANSSPHSIAGLWCCKFQFGLSQHCHSSRARNYFLILCLSKSKNRFFYKKYLQYVKVYLKLKNWQIRCWSSNLDQYRIFLRWFKKKTFTLQWSTYPNFPANKIDCCTDY